ncbi:MAG: ABC transporter ATP-binding protein [Burkholderiales bacterium]|jgi:NitT/TauT family transport system ATP-binding protein
MIKTEYDPYVSQPFVEVRSVYKKFNGLRNSNDLEILNDLSFSVPPGKFVVLLGPSGCGKTSILRLINGLISPDKGSILVDGNLPCPGPDIGFVFQSYRLIPWITVAKNIDFSLKAAHLTKTERQERVVSNLELVGLTKFQNCYPSELSGGMQQRVALARALAVKPRLLLMDEPFSSIDAQTRELMQIELMRIWEELKPAVIFVTHSVDEAITLADEIILLGSRPTKVIEVVPINLERPRWKYDIRSDKKYIELRSHLSNRMRELVCLDPESAFYGRNI